MKKITRSQTIESDAIIEMAFLPTDKKWEANPAIDGRIIESGNHMVEHLAKAIDKAQEMICFTSFIFQDGLIVEAIERATQRGVKVFVLTSTCHLKQNKWYDIGEDVKQETFKKLLNEKMQHKALVRCADNIHAKFLLIDPKSDNLQGWLATCNFTEKATKENPELLAVLKKEEIKELFQIFVWHFWKATTYEQDNTNFFRKIKPISRFDLPQLESLLLTSTKGNQTTIRDYSLEIIKTAQTKIVFSTFGFDIEHELGQLLLKKCEAGVEVEIFARNRFKVMEQGLKELAKAGAKIYTHDLLHAKFLMIDEQVGAIFTANFQERGMDEGFEVGLKLSHNDSVELIQVVERWKSEFAYKGIGNIPLQDLKDRYFKMTEKNLLLKNIEPKKANSKQIKPQKLEQIVNAWNEKNSFDKFTIKKHHFTLTVELEELNNDSLGNKKELRPSVYLAERSKKKGKKNKKGEQEATEEIVLITESVNFDELFKLEEHYKKPIFALK